MLRFGRSRTLTQLSGRADEPSTGTAEAKADTLSLHLGGADLTAKQQLLPVVSHAMEGDDV